MESLSLAKGATSVGGVLGTGAGVYCGTSGGVYIEPEFRGKIRGKLILAGKEIIKEGDSDGWTKAGKRYSAYLFFKKTDFKIENFEMSTVGNQIKEWCKSELLKDEETGNYGKAEKWCTEHVTMEDKLISEDVDIDLSKVSENSYQTLKSELSNNSEDLNHLGNQTSNNQKKAKSLEWCQYKQNADYDDYKSIYETLKKVCGKKNSN